MTRVFDKLQLKAHKEIVVLGAPASFEPEIARLEGVTVHRSLNGVPDVVFVLAFVKTQAELDDAVKQVTSRVKGDAMVWFAYPKGTSRRYASTINRDTGWDSLGAAGFESVRLVAIDEDWSALRFRRTEFIKALKRDPARAMSRAGKARSSSER